MTKDESPPRPKPGSAAELAAIYPAAREIEVHMGGEAATISVRALSIERIGAVADALGPALDEVTKAPSINALALVLVRHYKHTIRAVAAAVDWPPAQIGRIDASEFHMLVWAVIEANADFFVRLLGPVAFATPEATPEARGNGAGATPSDSSDAMGTPTPSVTH